MTLVGNLERAGWMLVLAAAIGGCGGGGSSSASAPPSSSGASAAPTAASSTAVAAPATGAGLGSTAGTPSSSRAAATAVANAGLGCKDFVAEPPEHANLGPTATESGICTVAGEKLAIGGYPSPADAEAAFQAAQTLACQAAKDTVNGTAIVVAGTQLLGLVDGKVDVSKQVATAVAGQVRIISC